jgi:peptidoglycan/xylan/chitin deacetylase (PgdA/CDA1 family)
MKIFLALAVFLSLVQQLYPVNASPTSPDANIYVLAYHSFLGKNFEMDFAPEVFQKQIESIRDLGYRFVSFSDIVAGKVSGNSNILITIDDGNHSIKKIFETVLTTNGIRPLLFIYPAITDRMHYSVTFRDLRYFLSQGAEIGAHGYYHLFVNEKLYKKDKRSFLKEIYRSKEKLEQKLETPVTVFCYPFGSFSDITEKTLKEAGYSYAFMLKSGILKAPLERNADPYQLPRYYVTKPAWNGIYKMLRDNLRGNRQARNRAEIKKPQGL